MAQERQVGVYQIRNNINGKSYYGSAVDIHRRIGQHKLDLKKNEHQNEHLQNSYNMYGKENFDFYPFIIINDKYLTFEQADDLSRVLEQVCFDFFESYDKEKGYNNSPIATGGGRFKDEEDLLGRKCKANKEQFDTIVQMLMNNRNSYNFIGKSVNLPAWYIKQIAEKKILKQLTENYIFPKRYEYLNEMNKQYGDEVRRRKNNGETFKAIADSLKLSPSTTEAIYHRAENITKKGVKQEVYKFTPKGEFIQKYYSIKEAANDNKTDSKYIGRACNRREGWGYSGQYIYSFQDTIPSLTLQEQLAGYKFSPHTSQPIIEYDMTDTPITFWRNRRELQACKVLTPSQTSRVYQSHKDGAIIFDSIWRPISRAKEEDLIYLLQLKENGNNIYRNNISNEDYIDNGEFISTKKSTKKIYQYTLTGDFMREFPSAQSVADEFKWNADTILQACKNKSVSYGYQWSFMYQDKTTPASLLEQIFPTVSSTRATPIIRYNHNKTPIKIYKTLAQVMLEVKGSVSEATLRNTLRAKNNKMYCGSYWKYAEDASQEDLQYLLQLKQEQQNSSHHVDE